jgi:hypothetical protein
MLSGSSNAGQTFKNTVCMSSTGHHMWKSCPLEHYIQRKALQAKPHPKSIYQLDFIMSEEDLYEFQLNSFGSYEYLLAFSPCRQRCPAHRHGTLNLFLLSVNLHRNTPSFPRKKGLYPLLFPRTSHLVSWP